MHNGLMHIEWHSVRGTYFIKLRIYDVFPDNLSFKESWNIDTDTGTNDSQDDLDEVFTQILDIFLTVFVRIVHSSTSKNISKLIF